MLVVFWIGYDFETPTGLTRRGSIRIGLVTAKTLDVTLLPDYCQNSCQAIVRCKNNLAIILDHYRYVIVVKFK